jgi:transcription elongation GreA/GreB family factor
VQIEWLTTLRETTQERLQNIRKTMEDSQAAEAVSIAEEEGESIGRRTEQVEMARRQLDLLENMRVDALHEQVSFGSIAISDVRNFFVSTSLTDIQVGDLEFLGIALESAIFQELKGKRKGDSFHLNGHEYRIEDVF